MKKRCAQLIDLVGSTTNGGIHRINNSKIIALKSSFTDSLGELLNLGIQQLLARAIEAELAEFLE